VKQLKEHNIVCDNCGKKWPDVSPPSKEAYDLEAVHIESMSMLLSENTIKNRHVTGVADSHALYSLAPLDFCCPPCLLAYIEKQKKLKSQ
jgi:hypothetical protein